MDDGTVSARVTGFVGTLRANGFSVGLSETADALLLTERGLFGREGMKAAWRSLLCGRADEWHRFNALFDSYWLPPNRSVMVESRSGGAGPIAREDGWADGGQVLGSADKRSENADAHEAAGGDAVSRGASAQASLSTADFRRLNEPAEVRAMETLIRAFARRFKRLRIRREAASLRPGRLDLRRSLRAGIGAGGSAPGRLRFRARRRVRPRLVLLIDVSKSMSSHSFFYLRVARALSLELGDVSAFLFHTSLTPIAEAIADPDPWRARERLQLLSAGWAGGTRIGESLEAFNRLHATRLVHTRTAVVIASDGYETGDAQVLGRELSQLTGRARLVAWLNPGKADPDWAPTASGMATALPCLDVLAAGNSLASLESFLDDVLRAL